MSVRVAINGFGRIGRLVLRAIIESKNDQIEVIAINDLGSIETNIHLLKYDSIHGILNQNIKSTSDGMVLSGKEIKVFSERDPENLPWNQLNIDVTLECTGIFTKKTDANKHISAGSKKVLISAPGKDMDYTPEGCD